MTRTADDKDCGWDAWRPACQSWTYRPAVHATAVGPMKSTCERVTWSQYTEPHMGGFSVRNPAWLHLSLGVKKRAHSSSMGCLAHWTQDTPNEPKLLPTGCLPHPPHQAAG
jgi:hypothetical protein